MVQFRGHFVLVVFKYTFDNCQRLVFYESSPRFCLYGHRKAMMQFLGSFCILVFVFLNAPDTFSLVILSKTSILQYYPMNVAYIVAIGRPQTCMCAILYWWFLNTCTRLASFGN